MSQGFRTRVVIGSRYSGDFGAQQRAVRALPSHARLPRVRRPSRFQRAIALIKFAAARWATAAKGDQP